MVGEIAIPPADHRYIRLDTDSPPFDGFDRNPYLAAFTAGQFTFVLVNVHLYFGSDDAPADIARRRVETYAVGRWADLRRDSDYAYTPNIIALGDFNMPQAEWGDPIYEALVNRGLYIPPRSTEVGGTNLAGDRHYDQIAFFPGPTAARNIQVGVFRLRRGAVRSLVRHPPPAGLLRVPAVLHLGSSDPVGAVHD